MKSTQAPRCKYLGLKMGAVLLLAAGRRAAALRVFKRMLELAPSDRYALASQAHVQMQLDRIDAAIVTLRSLTETAGLGAHEAVHWFNLAYALQQSGRADEAVSAFRTAVERDPRLDRAWYGLGLALMGQGRFSAAVEALKINTELQPMSPYGWYRLAQARLAMGELDSASKAVARLRGFEPRVAAQLERENPLLREARDAAR